MNSSSSVKTQSFLISVCRVVCVIRDETTTNHQNEPQSKCLLSAHQNKSVLSFVPEFISRTVIHIPQLQGGWSLSCDHGLDYASQCENDNNSNNNNMAAEVVSLVLVLAG